MSEKSDSSLDYSKPFLLVVEDDNVFRELLCKSLKLQGHIVRGVPNGLVAKTVFDLNQEKVRLIISDLRMPEFDGVELLKHVRSRSSVPFLVMTGFSEILDSEESLKLGANDFVPKPFRGEELKEIIERCLNPKPSKPEAAEEEEKPEPRYCSIHISEFLSATVLQSDIYVKMAGEKYIRVAYKGDTVPVERLRKYQDRKVDYLYVSIADFSKYVEFSLKLTSVATKNSKISKQTKAKLIKHTSEVMLAQCFLSEIESEQVQPAVRLVLDTMDVISGDDDILNIFANLQSHSDRRYSQGVAVATYSSLVAKLHGWHGANTHFKIVVSGLMRDIGLKEIDDAIIRKKRIQRTPAEQNAYESHPARGRQILYELRAIPEDVSTIVQQHHECPEGTGFPLGLTAEGIHPIARLIGTVDRFVNLMLPLEEATEQMPPKEALNHMHNRSADFDQTFFRRLCELFKYAPANG